MAYLQVGKTGGREGEDSTSQRGTGFRRFGFAVGGNRATDVWQSCCGGGQGLGWELGELCVCMRNSHVFPSDFQLLLRAGWVRTLAGVGKPDGAFQPEAAQVLLNP